jgi:hypothetical protein
MGLAGDAPTKDALKDTRTELYQLGKMVLHYEHNELKNRKDW